MTDLMKLVLSLSLSGSLLILALLLARPLLKSRATKAGQYYLWLLVIARLLLPFTPQASLMGTLFAQFDRKAQGTYSGQETVSGGQDAAFNGQDTASNGQGAVHSETGQGNTSAYDSNPTASGTSVERSSTAEKGTLPGYNSGSSEEGALISASADNAGTPAFMQHLYWVTEALLQNLWLIWLVTALILLVRKLTAYQSFIKCVKAGCREVSNTQLLDNLAQICAQSGINRPVELYGNQLVTSPMLLGFFRPCIVLPCAELPKQDFHHTILHELVHYKRRDLLYKWLVQITACLHWFNPLVWLMSREINRACELACDEAVLRLLPQQERHAYGDTLMHALEKGSPGSLCPSAPASVTLGENAKLLKERLNAILCFQPKIKWGACVSLLLTAALACGFTVSGAYGKLPSSSLPGPQKASQPANVFDLLPTDEPLSSPIPGAGTDAQTKLSQEENGYSNKDSRTDNSTLPKTDSSFSGKTYTYIYRQDGFYQAPYLFTLGWNLLERDLKHYESMELTLSDNSSITLLLDKSCRDFPRDTDACLALSALLAQLKADMAGTEYPLTLPMLVDVQNTGDSTPQELAKQFYGNNLLGFSAVYPLLDETEQRLFLDRAYNENEVSFYACCLKHVDADSDTLSGYAQKACANDHVALLSVTLYHLEPDNSLIIQYLQKAYERQNTAIFSVCLEHIENDRDVIIQYAQKAYEEDKTAFFAICLNHLEENDTAISQFTRKAYGAGKFAMFSICLDCLDPELPLFGELAETAYENGDVAFFSNLACRMDKDSLED